MAAASLCYTIVISVALSAFLYLGAATGWYSNIEDDAYFYTNIAYNLARTGVSSFDGVNVTDGYHLLWMGVLALASYVVGMATVSKFIHFFIFIFISVFICIRVSSRYGTTATEKLMLFFFFYWGGLLMETALLAWLILALLDSVLNDSKSSGRWSLLLAFLIPLTRIDAFMIPGAVSLALLPEKKLGRFFSFNACLALGMLAQLLLMRSIDGSFFSVSSELKATLEWGWYGNFIAGGAKTVPRVFFLLLLGCASLVSTWRHPDSRQRAVFAAAWLGVAFFSGIHLFFNYMSPWYFLPGHLVFAFILFRTTQRTQAPSMRWVRTGTFVVVLAFAVGLFLPRHSWRAYEARNLNQYRKQFAEKIDSWVPPGELIYQIDGAGYTGFFSSRPVVNGDGLVNSHRYVKCLKDGKLQDYLDELGIRYILSDQPVEGGAVFKCGGLTLALEDVVLVSDLNDDQVPAKYRESLYRLYRRK